MPHPKDIPLSLTSAVNIANDILTRYQAGDSQPLAIVEEAAIGKLIAYVISEPLPPAWRGPTAYMARKR